MAKALMIAFIFIWCGLIIGISFMEAPLKFQAPNITLPLGLGIGRLVFSTLNKIELGIAISSIALIGLNRLKITPLFFLIIFFLLLQTFWLLPQLDIRAIQIIQGTSLTPNNLHLYYVVIELVKLLMLLFVGLDFTNKNILKE